MRIPVQWFIWDEHEIEVSVFSWTEWQKLLFASNISFELLLINYTRGRQNRREEKQSRIKNSDSKRRDARLFALLFTRMNVDDRSN